MNPQLGNTNNLWMFLYLINLLISSPIHTYLCSTYTYFFSLLFWSTNTTMAPTLNFNSVSNTVCVMDASTRLGSSLVKRLLTNGYTVHAATQNIHNGSFFYFLPLPRNYFPFLITWICNVCLITIWATLHIDDSLINLGFFD